MKKLVLVVDYQNSDNPSPNKKEYEINLSTALHSLGNVSDTLIITSDYKVCVIRRIEVNSLGFPTVLKQEKLEEYGTIEIQFFLGINYVYLKDNPQYSILIQYLLKNSFTDFFPSKTEMQSKISATTKSILLQVESSISGEKLISSLNMTDSNIKLKSSLLELEGYTSINGSFAVDEKGNVIIANEAVILNQDGIYLRNGARIIGTHGLLSSFQYSSGNDLNHTGFGYNFVTTNTTAHRPLDIVAYIPAQFTVTEAKITLYHAPVWYYSSIDLTEFWGYCRNLNLYKIQIEKFEASSYIGSEFYLDDVSDLTLIKEALNSYTPTVPTSQIHKVESIVSKDIKDYLTPGMNKFKIMSSDALPPDEIEASKKTGLCIAFLNVFGYMQHNEKGGK